MLYQAKNIRTHGGWQRNPNLSVILLLVCSWSRLRPNQGILSCCPIVDNYKIDFGQGFDCPEPWVEETWRAISWSGYPESLNTHVISRLSSSLFCHSNSGTGSWLQAKSKEKKLPWCGHSGLATTEPTNRLDMSWFKVHVILRVVMSKQLRGYSSIHGEIHHAQTIPNQEIQPVERTRWPQRPSRRLIATSRLQAAVSFEWLTDTLKEQIQHCPQANVYDVYVSAEHLVEVLINLFSNQDCATNNATKD
jgi:hypothetical protein